MAAVAATPGTEFVSLRNGLSSRLSAQTETTPGEGCEGRSHCSALDAARLQFPLDPGHFDGAERLPPGMSMPCRQHEVVALPRLDPRSCPWPSCPDTTAARAKNLILQRQWPIADRLWLPTNPFEISQVSNAAKDEHRDRQIIESRGRSGFEAQFASDPTKTIPSGWQLVDLIRRVV